MLQYGSTLETVALELTLKPNFIYRRLFCPLIFFLHTYCMKGCRILCLVSLLSFLLPFALRRIFKPTYIDRN